MPLTVSVFDCSNMFLDSMMNFIYRLCGEGGLDPQFVLDLHIMQFMRPDGQWCPLSGRAAAEFAGQWLRLIRTILCEHLLFSTSWQCTSLPHNTTLLSFCPHMHYWCVRSVIMRLWPSILALYCSV